MGLIRCPECEELVKFSNTDESTVTCSKCDFEIPLENDAPKPTRKKKKKKKKGDSANLLLNLLPLVLILPLLVCLCVSPFHHIVGFVGAGVSAVVGLGALIMTVVAANRAGLMTMDDTPLWFFADTNKLFFIFQVMWAVQRPRQIAPWFAVQCVAYVVTGGCFILGIISYLNREMPPFHERLEQRK